MPRITAETATETKEFVAEEVARQVSIEAMKPELVVLGKKA